jgi:hypothetical protein
VYEPTRPLELFAVTEVRYVGFLCLVLTGEAAASVNYALVSGVKKVKGIA